jgi:hypothetical protein
MINLEQFISLCNLEGVYFFTAIEEREHCWCIVMGNNPKNGRTLDKLEPYYHKIIKNISFNNENSDMMILVEVE